VKLDPGAHVFYAFGFALKSGCDNQTRESGSGGLGRPDLAHIKHALYDSFVVF
jgi:hypothetical protein